LMLIIKAGNNGGIPTRSPASDCEAANGGLHHRLAPKDYDYA
jgi:hypothetical protein